MDHRIPRIGAALSVILVIAAAITFLFLNARFEGPEPIAGLRHPFELTARFKDSRTLPPKQPVLYKGIQVGRVKAVDWDPGTRQAVIRFSLDKDLDVHEDAVVRIGDVSLLGDNFLDLVSLGSPRARLLHAGDEIKRTRASVNFDEAFDFLDADGRRRVRSLVNTIADGIAGRGSEERIGSTVSGVSRTVLELNALTRSLQGQEASVARFVSSASTLVSETGRRERAVREIVAGGRSTVDALAADTQSFEQALVELPRLLRAGTRALNTGRTLFTQARPTVAKLRAIAPDLRRALDADAPYPLAQLSTDAIATINGLPALRKQAVPVLGRLDKLNPKLLGLVRVATPAVRELVAMLDYVAPRAKDIGVMYAMFAALFKRTDATGRHIAVGAFDVDPAELLDSPAQANCDPATQNQSPNQGYCNNAYPKRGDALNPQPFAPPYPRLKPCTPPPRSQPTRPCE